ncbi:MAG: DNA translocase FtsK 4TM domain-containing protein, partial [Candidatus Kerfeldbacteria bacterium]|nr:DNA translocase FtsK 4TM domain-containing protein [Candidatus Kerfeldbacteria bacterium]
MASTRKSRPTRPAERPVPNPRPTVSPETQRGILIVLLFALGFLAILSLADLAGSVGRGYDVVLLRLFGWGRFLVPAILLGIGVVLLQPHRLPFRAMNGLGLFLFLVSFSGLLHLFIPLDESETAIAAGNGGGYIGFGIALPLLRLMGFWASLVILVALFVISILIFFNTSLTELARRGGAVGTLGTALRRIPSLRSRDHGEPSFDRAPVREEPQASEDVPLTDVPTSPQTSSKPRQQLSLLPKKKSRPTRLSLDLLSPERTVPSSGDIRDRQERIRRTLHNFGIEVEMREVQVGPTVTQFALTPAEGVKLSQITTLGNDLALALAAHPIRIEAPIPGRSAVGIEVPNESVATVTIREVLESEPFRHARSPLTVALGKDVSGQTVTTDLGVLPHLLIAGATGSGKSVMINALIVSLLYQNSPGDLRFIMVDPKRVELTVYNDIPHLLTPVITDSRKTVNALKWIVAEMDRRYEVLSQAGKRDINTYHRDVDDGMPFIVVIIDELADLMSVAAREVEGAVTRLAQMARAVGIH